MGVAPIVREFRTNLWDKVGSSVFVQGKWVPFDEGTINKVANVWFYFVSAKLFPSNHLSTTRKGKALLTYAIVKWYKFNIGKVIENLIFESAYRKEITHPSLIKKLCELEEVPIGENEEKYPPMQ